ncbi:hypothetical protein AZKH_2598 [Azoarcus sp. KH32C]|nr:hypothetical protein AZKH_2598 [Azoarcus sp. KH32C]
MNAESAMKRASRRRRIVWTASVAGVVLAAILATILLPSPKAPVHLTNEVTITRPIGEVFEYVTTPGNWPKWHPSSLAVSGAIDHSLNLGEQATEDFLVAGRRGRAVWTVVERDAPRLWKIEGGGEEGGRAWITYTLREEAGATHFTRDMRYRMPNLLTALLDPLLTRKQIAAESDLAVRQLKAALER